MKKFFANVKRGSPVICRQGAIIQVHTALLYNAHIKSYIKGEIFQSQSKIMCVPGLLADETFNLYDQRGKVEVINFWVTRCGPCVAEIPHFNRLAEEFPDIKENFK